MHHLGGLGERRAWGVFWGLVGRVGSRKAGAALPGGSGSEKSKLQKSPEWGDGRGADAGGRQELVSREMNGGEAAGRCDGGHRHAAFFDYLSH